MLKRVNVVRKLRNALILNKVTRYNSRHSGFDSLYRPTQDKWPLRFAATKLQNSNKQELTAKQGQKIYEVLLMNTFNL